MCSFMLMQQTTTHTTTLAIAQKFPNAVTKYAVITVLLTDSRLQTNQLHPVPKAFIKDS